MQDLAARYPDPPPPQDAVLLLQPALAVLAAPKISTNIPFYGGVFPAGNVPFERSMLDEIRASIEKNQEAFDSVPWDKLQSAWIGSGFQKGFTNLTEVPISKVNSLVKLLCLNAALEAERQHPKEAAQSLQHALEIERTLRNDTVLHGLAKLAIQNLVCSSLNRVLNRTKLADSDLKLLADSLTRTNLGTTRELIFNERAFGLAIAEYLRSLARQSAKQGISPVRWVMGSYRAKLIYRDQDLLDCLDQIENNIPPLDLPLSNGIPTLLTLENESKTASDALEKERSPAFLTPFKKHRISLLSIAAPARVRSMYASEAKTLAYVRVTRAAIAVERWRLSHDNHLPESPSALTPDFLPSVPLDPFDEQPLRYKKLEHGYVVYSIGMDFTDDNGTPEPRDAKDSDHYDIVFSVVR